MNTDRDRLLEGARRAYAARGWAKAAAGLRRADADGPLGAQDLERLAWAARWSGEHEAALEPFERAYAAFAERGEAAAAARVALDLCHACYDRRNRAMATGWWMQAKTHLDPLPEGREHGRLAWYLGRTLGQRGDAEGWRARAAEAEAIGRRVGDPDVEALGLADRGHALVGLGRPREGVPLLDQAAARATSGRLGLHAAGVVFCSVVWACRARGDWERAREWTGALGRFCARANIDYFPGLCQLHRAEVLRLAGALEEAEREAERACEQTLAATPVWAGPAYAELGEVRRRRGDRAGASEAFRRSIELGWEPQPGFARLLLEQGDLPGALRALRRALSDGAPVALREERGSLLALRTTLALAAGEREEARAAAEALGEVAAEEEVAAVRALARGAAGELALAEERYAEATAALRAALREWTALDAPYEAAGVRARLAEALAAEGDAAAAELEREAARTALERIGAPAEALIAPCSAAGSGAPAPVEAVWLRREGEIWTLRFRERTLRLRDARGLRYLARLLREPGREIAATELAAGEASEAPPSDAGERLDARALADYRERLESLRAELEEAEAWNDAGRAERLREEIEALSGELAAASGLGGRPRRERSDAERARQAVTKAIRAAIRRIAAESPELGELLGRQVRTGTFCRCEADPLRRVRWEVEEGERTVTS